jgi:hypothetical protein
MIGRSTVHQVIRGVVLIHLGVISSVPRLPVRVSRPASPVCPASPASPRHRNYNDTMFEVLMNGGSSFRAPRR